MSANPIQLADRRNVHPVDRMADIKEQIAELETEFAHLRQQVIAGTVSPVGERWRATVREGSYRLIKAEEAQRLLPEAVFNSLVTAVSRTAVYLNRRKKKSR